GRNVDRVAASLDCLDGRACGDAAHDRHGDGAATLVLGGCPHAPEVALNDAGREAAGAGAHAVTDRVGEPHHLDRARAVGQTPDESALFKGCDQAVDARLRPQV